MNIWYWILRDPHVVPALIMLTIGFWAAALGHRVGARAGRKAAQIANAVSTAYSREPAAANNRQAVACERIADSLDIIIAFLKAEDEK